MWRGGGLLGRPFSQQVGGRLVALLWDLRIVQATHMLEIALLLHDLKLALLVLEVLLRLLEGGDSVDTSRSTRYPTDVLLEVLRSGLPLP